MESHHAKTQGADILRGVAILVVLVYHVFGGFYVNFIPWHGHFRDFNAPRSLLNFWLYPISLGWAGVALFFVLSGFCIHLSFLRNQSFSLGNFFWRRFWRIYPAYFVTLVIFTACNYRHINFLSTTGAGLVSAHLLLLHNMSNATFLGINGSLWSIATEIQLYLLFPLLLCLRARFGMGKCLLFTFVLGLGWRVAAVHWWGLPVHVINAAFTCPLMTWFDWSLGAFVAECFFAGQRAFVRPAVWLGVLVPVFVVSTLYQPCLIFSFSLAAANAAIALDMALNRPWGNPPWLRFLAFLGLVSYSLYLWHEPLLFPIVHGLERVTHSPLAAFSLLLPALLAVAWVSFHYLEQTGIRLGSTLRQRITRLPKATSTAPQI